MWIFYSAFVSILYLEKNWNKFIHGNLNPPEWQLTRPSLGHAAPLLDEYVLSQLQVPSSFQGRVCPSQVPAFYSSLGPPAVLCEDSGPGPALAWIITHPSDTVLFPHLHPPSAVPTTWCLPIPRHHTITTILLSVFFLVHQRGQATTTRPWKKLSSLNRAWKCDSTSLPKRGQKVGSQAMVWSLTTPHCQRPISTWWHRVAEQGQGPGTERVVAPSDSFWQTWDLSAIFKG